MKIDLKKYMNERDAMRSGKKPGPVVTISREYGCEANDLAIKLIRRITTKQEEKTHFTPWKYISKEVITDSAKDLKLSPRRLEQRVITHGTNPVSDIFSGLSGSYGITDEEIIEHVRDIVETYGRNGNVIIIGRGGSTITQNIPRSLHIRLVAPLDWRIRQVAEKKGMDPTEARAHIMLRDHERRMWTEHLTGQSFSFDLYDVVYNRRTMKTEEIVDSIFRLMEERGMV
jgi:cytidylate kinase